MTQTKERREETAYGEYNEPTEELTENEIGNAIFNGGKDIRKVAVMLLKRHNEIIAGKKEELTQELVEANEKLKDSIPLAKVQEVFANAEKSIQEVAVSSGNTLGAGLVNILIQELKKELLSKGKEKGKEAEQDIATVNKNSVSVSPNSLKGKEKP